jgi:hypothetical protein
VRYGHSTLPDDIPPFTSDEFARPFHDKCNEAFQAALVRTSSGAQIRGISRALWRDKMTDIMREFFENRPGQGFLRDERIAELNSWIEANADFFLP